LRIFALLTLLVSAADHWTTYLCLRSPVPGWQVTEANPIAVWLFDALGLIPGLLVDSAVTLAAVSFLVVTRTVPQLAKILFFALVIAWTTLAVANNLRAVEALGISPLGS